MVSTSVCFVHGDALDLFRGRNGERFGGAETQVYLLANLLAKEDDFSVYVAGPGDVSDLIHQDIGFRTLVPPVQHGIPYLSRYVNRSRAHRPFKGLAPGVLIQTIAGGNTIAVWRAARSMGLKFVYRMSFDADIDGSVLSASQRDEYFAALRDADGVIAQSETQQQRLAEELSVASCLIPNVVEVPDEPPPSGGSHILWVGRAAAIKRPWILIETARCMPEYQFVMVMPKEDQLFWMSVVRETEHVPNLTLIPGAQYFEMGAHYKTASILVSTSVMEGFPNVFLQAAAQGRPIVSLDVDPNGMLELGGAGLCAHGDVSRFRDMVSHVMSDSEIRTEMGIAAHRYVADNHSPKVVGPRLADFLRAVASA